VATTDYVLAELADNIHLDGESFVLRFEGCDFLTGALPGQFVMLRGEDWGCDPILPRAFSLLAVEPSGRADILAKAAGKASRILAVARPGSRFSILGPLGNSIPEPSNSMGERTPVDDWLVAGGVGLAPLYMYARRAAELGRASRLTLFYGGRSARDLVLLDEIGATGVELLLATEDGSAGLYGYVTAAVERALDERAENDRAPRLIGCGPDPMLEATARVARARGLECLLSLEGEMACGVGACLVCAVPCRGPRPFRYACVDGPVFDLRDLAGVYAEVHT
jgi:dihydroorotate dehydrogenase electron transfer subunit